MPHIGIGSINGQDTVPGKKQSMRLAAKPSITGNHSLC